MFGGTRGRPGSRFPTGTPLPGQCVPRRATRCKPSTRATGKRSYSGPRLRKPATVTCCLRKPPVPTIQPTPLLRPGWLAATSRPHSLTSWPMTTKSAFASSGDERRAGLRSGGPLGLGAPDHHLERRAGNASIRIWLVQDRAPDTCCEMAACHRIRSVVNADPLAVFGKTLREPQQRRIDGGNPAQRIDRDGLHACLGTRGVNGRASRRAGDVESVRCQPAKQHVVNACCSYGWGKRAGCLENYGIIRLQPVRSEGDDSWACDRNGGGPGQDMGAGLGTLRAHRCSAWSEGDPEGVEG